MDENVKLNKMKPDKIAFKHTTGNGRKLLKQHSELSDKSDSSTKDTKNSIEIVGTEEI